MDLTESDSWRSAADNSSPCDRTRTNFGDPYSRSLFIPEQTGTDRGSPGNGIHRRDTRLGRIGMFSTMITIVKHVVIVSLRAFVIAAPSETSRPEQKSLLKNRLRQVSGCIDYADWKPGTGCADCVDCRDASD